MFIDVMKCELYVSVTFNNLSDQQSVMKPYASTLLPYRDMCMVTVYGWK